MKVHPREQQCRAAAHELLDTLVRIKEKHGLTEAEMLRVVNEESSSWIAGVAKYSIRAERHGDYETPGGMAPTQPEGDPHE